MKVNVFVVGTEYHFLMANFIIQEHFSSQDYENRLVFLGKRLSQVQRNALPSNIISIDYFFDQENMPANKVKTEILVGNVINLFLVNVYRASDTLIVSMTTRHTKCHLIQDGALFYNRIEKSIWKNRIKETYNIYSSLWKKGIPFRDLIWYGRFMEESDYIDEIWMTNPNEYVGPTSSKKVNLIKFFPNKESKDQILSYFEVDNKLVDGFNNQLIYLAPIIKDEKLVDLEIVQIKQILKKINLKDVIIKLHPNTKDFHLHKLKKEFGDSVIRNFIPAELYIAQSVDSVVVGCASTTLFYHNPKCKYFALKEFYQKLGIYEAWKNVNLPKHVNVVNEFYDINV